MGILARQTAWNTVFTYLGVVLGFVNVVLLYPKILQADQFGLTRLLVSVGAMVAQVAHLGTENTVIRYFPYFKDPERQHRGLLGMLLLFGTIVSSLAILVLALCEPWLVEAFSDRSALFAAHWWLLMPLVLSEIFFILFRSYSRSLRRAVQPTFIREFLLRAVQTVLILVQAFTPMPFGSFVALFAGTFLAATCMLALDLYSAGHFKLGTSHMQWRGRLRRSMRNYTFYTFWGSMAGIVLGNMDQFMIGALMGKDALVQVAHYSVAFYFGSVIATPGRAMVQVAAPLLAEAWKRDDRGAIGAMYRRSAIVQSLLSCFLFLLVWTGLADLFRLLPLEYAEAADVALVIGLAYVVNSASGLAAGIIGMSRSYRLDAWSSLSMLVINALGNFFLIRSMGIMGAAVATLLSLVAVNVYRTWFLWKRYALWPFVPSLALLLPLTVGIGLGVPKIPLTGEVIVDLPLRALIVALLFWPIGHLAGLTSDLVALWNQVRASIAVVGRSIDRA